MLFDIFLKTPQRREAFLELAIGETALDVEGVIKSTQILLLSTDYYNSRA